jgi:rRNA maturation RNase YbeY
MIFIKNNQKKIIVNIHRLHECAQIMLKFLKYQDFDLSINLTTNTTIQKYNKKFRGKDKPTDILSFPFHENLKAGKRIDAKIKDNKNLGDIIISLEYAQKDAKTTWNRKFDDHLIALLAHGIAHLIGYDHQTDTEFKAMLKMEKALLKVVNIKY